MIKLENVSKAYSAGIPALNDVSLHIETGERSEERRVGKECRL